MMQESCGDMLLAKGAKEQDFPTAITTSMRKTSALLCLYSTYALPLSFLTVFLIEKIKIQIKDKFYKNETKK